MEIIAFLVLRKEILSPDVKVGGSSSEAVKKIFSEHYYRGTVEDFAFVFFL